MNFRQHVDTEVNVNLTPLIDVVFLLLIFFMVSTSFTKETHLKIDLPEAVAEAAQRDDTAIELVVNSDGKYALNGQELVDTKPATLKRALGDMAGEDRKLPFMITADANTPHQAVVTAMDVAGQMGFVHLKIATQRPSN